MNKIGRKLREIRVRRGLTQTELAEGIVTPSMISQIESGKTNPSYGILVQLANRLATPIEYFLNEMEEPFSNSAKLRLAEYHLLLREPERALDFLDDLRPATPLDLQAVRAHETEVGVSAWHVLLLTARAYRMQMRFDEAEQLVEIVRENLHLERNPFFELLLLRESGQIEYDTNNPEGAIHEWEKAVEYGEVLLHSHDHPHFDVRRVLVDVLLGLARSLRRLGELEAAQTHLDRAAEVAAPIATLRGAAAAMLDHARALLKSGETAEAKLCAERGISMVEAGHAIALAASAVRFARPVEGLPAWDMAAEATIGVQPDAFLEAQVIALEESLDAADAESSRRLAAPIPVLLDACRASGGLQPARLYWLEARVVIADIGLKLKTGHTQAALAMAEEWLTQLTSQADAPLRIRLLRRLVEWHALQGHREAVESLVTQLTLAVLGRPMTRST